MFHRAKLMDPGPTLMTRAGPSVTTAYDVFVQWTFRAYPSSTTPHLTSSIFKIFKHVLGTPEQSPMPDPTMFQVWKDFFHKEAISFSMGSMWSMRAHRNVLNCDRNFMKLCDAVLLCWVKCFSRSLWNSGRTRGERLCKLVRT